MRTYIFGPYQLDPVKRQLRKDNRIVPLTPKVLELLCVLVERRGGVVEKEEIIRRVWPDTIVEDSNLNVNVSVLRKALGDNQRDHRFIVTLPGRGYSFIADVTEISPNDNSDDHASSDHPVSRTQSDYVAALIGPVSGALPLNSPFYISRPTDGEFLSAIARHDSIILLKGARQVGKTSLLARGLQQARQWGAKVILTDFQDLNAVYLESVEKFFLMLSEVIAEQLELKTPPNALWSPNIGPSANFERYWRRVVLTEDSSPIIWGMDEVDRLFTCHFASEVFGLLRSWHNKRALDPAAAWSKVTLAMSYATEAHLFITDLNQSPFNVGTRLEIGDFTIEQIRELNLRYGSPLSNAEELQQFFGLVGGHPYLANRGLWEIKTHQITLVNLAAQADQEDGAFSDHLRRLLFSIKHDLQATEAMRAMLQEEPCPNAEVFYRLRSAGAISGHSAREAIIRNELYRIFLSNRL